MAKKFVAEFVGTVVLSSVVFLALVGTPPVPVPVLVGLTLLMLMYSIGHVAGLHINPAVTIGLWSVGKIRPQVAAVYVIAQLLGAAFTLLVFSHHIGMPSLVAEATLWVWIAEFVGTMMLSIGIGSIAFGKVTDSVSGLVLGAAIFLGVTFASFLGSNGMLNPAVALATDSLNITYAIAPILGSVTGFWLYKAIFV